MKHINSREEWLVEMTKIVKRTLFKQAVLKDLKIKDQLDISKIQFNMAYTPNQRVKSVKYASGNAGLKKQSHIGLCWHPHSIGKEEFGTEIFITPNLTDTNQIVGVLIHELCHVLTRGHGHRGKFKSLALAIGLAGKMTSTYETPELIEKIKKWSKKLGKFPHKKWLPNLNRKKQSTRMIKAYCTHIDSDYIVRLSRTTLIKHGTPRCPVQVLNHDNELEICNHRLGTDDPELNDLLYQTLLNQGMTD